MNIAKILEKHPKGLKLYSPTFGDVIFEGIKSDGWIVCTVADTGMTILFYTDGKYSKKGELVLFPSKTNRNWETFPKPFVDGDIVTCECGAAKQIFIFKEYTTNGAAICYCFLDVDDTLNTDGNIYYVTQHATQQEKERFFIALNKHGYRWNPETKTLKKLPKFKIGDEIVKKNSISNSYIISSVSCEFYGLKLSNNQGMGVLRVDEQDDWELISRIKPIFKKGDKVRVKKGVSEPRIIEDVCDTFYTLVSIGKIDFTDQDNWELVPHKFDTNTLKPFDKVLVRDYNRECWMTGVYSHQEMNIFIASGHWKQCIPYKNNEYLLGTANDCNDFYKTWKE